MSQTPNIKHEEHEASPSPGKPPSPSPGPPAQLPQAWGEGTPSDGKSHDDNAFYAVKKPWNDLAPPQVPPVARRVTDRAGRFRRGQLARVWNEHTKSGAHRARKVAYPEWVPEAVRREAEALTVAEAEEMLAPWLGARRSS